MDALFFFEVIKGLGMAVLVVAGILALHMAGEIGDAQRRRQDRDGSQ